MNSLDQTERKINLLERWSHGGGKIDVPKRVTVTGVTTCSGIREREAIDGVRPNDTETRIDGTGTDRETEPKHVSLPLIPINSRHLPHQINRRILRLVLLQLPILRLLLQNLTRERPLRVAPAQRDLLERLLLDLSGRRLAVLGVALGDAFRGLFLAGLAQLLGGDELCVWSGFVLEEFVVTALGEDETIAHDVDAVGVLDGRETVSDSDRSTSYRQKEPSIKQLEGDQMRV